MMHLLKTLSKNKEIFCHLRSSESQSPDPDHSITMGATKQEFFSLRTDYENDQVPKRVWKNEITDNSQNKSCLLLKCYACLEWPNG